MLLLLGALLLLGLIFLLLLLKQQLSLLYFSVDIIGSVVILIRLLALLVDSHELAFPQLVQLDLEVFFVILQLQYLVRLQAELLFKLFDFVVF